MKWLRRFAVFLLTLSALAMYCAFSADVAKIEKTFEVSDKPLNNPYTGNVIWATKRPNDKLYPFTLVYVDATWAKLEPAEGEYDFEWLESSRQFELWKRLGKKAVFRLVLDMPADEKHMDIPEWLAKKTGGEYYDCEYGRGYMPNYSSSVFIAAHARLLEALAARYDRDGFFAFIELGSLGHWGEWHVNSDAGKMPAKSVQTQYISAYAKAFKNAKLMVRRPFAAAKSLGMGLYNDVAGDPDETAEWLDWIATGEGGGSIYALSAMQNAWQTAPVGGELDPSLSKEHMLTKYKQRTIELLRRSRASWIGPNSFSDEKLDESLFADIDELMLSVGYRLRVSKFAMSASGENRELELSWTNDGTAPFYFDYQPIIAVRSNDRITRYIKLPLDLRALLPGVTRTIKVKLANEIFSGSGTRVYAGALDPKTGRPAIELAMDAPSEGGLTLLWSEG